MIEKLMSKVFGSGGVVRDAEEWRKELEQRRVSTPRNSEVEVSPEWVEEARRAAEEVRRRKMAESYRTPTSMLGSPFTYRPPPPPSTHTHVPTPAAAELDSRMGVLEEQVENQGRLNEALERKIMELQQELADLRRSQDVLLTLLTAFQEERSLTGSRKKILGLVKMRGQGDA